MEKEEYMVVEGATITPAMAGQIKEWQNNESLDNLIFADRAAIDYIIDEVGLKDYTPEDAMLVLPLLVGLRDTITALEKFKVSQ